MNKILKSWAYMAGLGMAFLCGACDDDIDPVIEDLDLNRVLTPLDMEARVQNKTELKLDWTRAADAEKYVVEIHEDSLVFENLVSSYEVLPTDVLIVKGLEGETLYSVRIKGVHSKKEDSKWAALTVKTDKENIMNKVADADIEAKAATVRWTAGLTVTHLTYKVEGSADQPVRIDLDETAKTDGAYRLTGLTGETTYVVKIFNATKERGNTTFKTLVDIGDATAVHEGDDLKAILDAAEEGDVLAIFPGAYELGDYTFTKSVSLKGVYPADKPVLTGRVLFGGDIASFVMENIALKGEDPSSTSNPFQIASTCSIGSILIEKCEISGYKSHFFYDNSSNSTIESLKINNSLIDGITGNGGDGFDMRKTAVRNLQLTNSTFSNGFRTFIRMQYNGDLSQDILIDHCTFYRIATFDDGNNKGILMLDKIATPTVTIKNSIFYGIGDGTADYGLMSNNKCKAQVTLSGNNYYASPRLWTGKPFVGKASDFDNAALEVDPGFADAAKGDFTISNEDLIYKGIGDPRWIK